MQKYNIDIESLGKTSYGLTLRTSGKAVTILIESRSYDHVIQVAIDLARTIIVSEGA